MVTNGDPEGLRKSTFYGVDAVWRTSSFHNKKNLLIGGWTGATTGDQNPGSRAGWGFKVDYPNDFLDCMTTVNRFGEALDPLLGFLPRPGVRFFQASCRLQPRPSKDGPFRSIRQFSIGNYYEQCMNAQGFHGILEFRHNAAQSSVRVWRSDRGWLHASVRNPPCAVRDRSRTGHPSGVISVQSLAFAGNQQRASVAACRRNEQLRLFLQWQPDTVGLVLSLDISRRAPADRLER